MDDTAAAGEDGHPEDGLHLRLPAQTEEDTIHLRLRESSVRISPQPPQPLCKDDGDNDSDDDDDDE